MPLPRSLSIVTTDVHQHLWPPAFVAALRRRRAPPRLDGWVLHLAGERPWPLDPQDHDVDARAALAAVDGDDRVLVAPSAALGIDRLPPAEAVELTGTWIEAALGLPEPFRAWAGAGVREPDAGALRAALDDGAVGLEVAADVLAAPDGLDRLAPLLAVLEERGAALLVHPGPAGAADAPGRPRWWAPVVSYVGQLHAAWWAWSAGGRERFPRLPVCFAALAGLAPLHVERHRARGGEPLAVDPFTFVETSSYGERAIEAVGRVLGIDVICHGSDRPYAESRPPDLGAAATAVIRITNPGRLLASAREKVAA
jgi:6-methylsalicylate decarboxylase